MEVSNDTRAVTFSVPMKDKDGRSLLVIVAKFTFAIDPLGKVSVEEETPAEIDLVDTYNGDDAGGASIRRPSQVFDAHPGTCVLLVGHAHPPLRRNASHVDVSMRVGPIHKTVRAHGFRVWQKGTFSGLSPGPTMAIREPVPLIYELAWGGMDLSDPAKFVGEPRNLVGRGVARDPAKLVGQPAAQLEDPESPLTGRHPAPASFGAIHRHWEPRAAFAGTYDEAWSETRMPLLPADFDARFHVCVPHDQWSQAPLRGDEPFEILGATPEGSWRFQLPRVAIGFSSTISGVQTEHRTHLDTIFIDADAGRVEQTFRASFLLPRKYEMVERILVVEKDVR